MKRTVALVMVGLILLCLTACGQEPTVLDSPAGAFEVGRFTFREDFGPGQYPADGNRFLTVYVVPTAEITDITTTLRETFCSAEPAQIESSIGSYICDRVGYEFSEETEEQRYALLFDVPASLEEAGSIKLIFPGGANAILREE